MEEYDYLYLFIVVLLLLLPGLLQGIFNTFLLVLICTFCQYIKFQLTFLITYNLTH